MDAARDEVNPVPTGDADGRGPETSDDFATEHASPTLADQMEGGPERARDPDSPKGHAGMD